jgi:hypothetical protein
LRRLRWQLAVVGGGDSDPKPPPAGLGDDVQKVLEAFNRNAATSIANKGVYATQLLASESIGSALSTINGNLVVLSVTNSGDVATVTASCVIGGSGSGSYTLSATKVVSRLGLSAGDKVTTTFTNCKLGDSKYVLNGKAESIIKYEIVNLVLSNFEANYQTKFTNFSVKKDLIDPVIFEGLVNVSWNLVGLSNLTMRLTVPTGQSLILTTSGIAIQYKTGTALVAMENTAAGGVASHKLDGDVAFTKAGKTTALYVTTPKPLSGDISSTGAFNVTSGMIDAKDIGNGDTTSTTFDATKAVITAKIGGIAVTPFNSSWLELLSVPSN